MNTLIVYYSYTGNCKKMAETEAQRDGYSCQQILEVKRPGKFKAYVAGCIAALGMKGWPIQSISADLTAFERIIVFSPVWAGHTAPAVNTLLQQIPQGKTVEVRMVSSSGNSSARDKIDELLTRKGCTLAKYSDIKA